MKKQFDKKVCNFKLYKAHKQWFTACSVFIGVAGGLLLASAPVHASVPGTTTTASSTPTVTQVASGAQSGQATSSQTNAGQTSSATATPTSSTTTPANNQATNNHQPANNSSNLSGIITVLPVTGGSTGSNPAETDETTITGTVTHQAINSQNAAEYRQNSVTVAFNNVQAGSHYRVLIAADGNSISPNNISFNAPSMGNSHYSGVQAYDGQNYFVIDDYFTNSGSVNQTIQFYLNQYPRTDTEVLHPNEVKTRNIYVGQVVDNALTDVQNIAHYTETLTQSWAPVWDSNSNDYTFNYVPGGDHEYSLFFGTYGHSMWSVNLNTGFNNNGVQDILNWNNLGVKVLKTHIQLPAGAHLVSGNSVVLSTSTNGYYKL